MDEREGDVSKTGKELKGGGFIKTLQLLVHGLGAGWWALGAELPPGPGEVDVEFAVAQHPEWMSPADVCVAVLWWSDREARGLFCLGHL